MGNPVTNGFPNGQRCGKRVHCLAPPWLQLYHRSCQISNVYLCIQYCVHCWGIAVTTLDTGIHVDTVVILLTLYNRPELTSFDIIMTHFSLPPISFRKHGYWWHSDTKKPRYWSQLPDIILCCTLTDLQNMSVTLSEVTQTFGNNVNDENTLFWCIGLRVPSSIRHKVNKIEKQFSFITSMQSMSEISINH